MYRFRASLIVTALLMVSLISLGSAAAGGPTSALLSVPGEGKTASLYYTDPGYDALARLVGIEGATGTGETDPSGRDHTAGPGVTVTWLIHDVAPWRVDHIYPNDEGAPWIATQLLDIDGAGSDGSVTWHQATDGPALTALLDKLGVGKAARQAGSFDGVAGAAVPPPAAAVAADEPAPADTSGIAGIWWALAGLVIGVLATVLGTRIRRSSAPGPDAPPADSSPEVGEPQITVAETLSGPTSRR